MRDSAVWYYGMYTFLVAAAALCDPTFTRRLLGWYRRIIPVFFAWAPIAVVLSRKPRLGYVPGTFTPVNASRPVTSPSTPPLPSPSCGSGSTAPLARALLDRPACGPDPL
jgi:hypothetical protein